MLKSEKSYINESIVTLLLIFIFGYDILEKIIYFANPSLLYVISIFQKLLITVVFLKQIRLFGLHLDNKALSFLCVYSIFVLFQMTILNIYPLSALLGAPSSVMNFLINTVLIALTIMSLDYIVYYFNPKALFILMFLFTTIPSLFYINTIGVETLQIYSVESFDTQFVSLLRLGYANSPVIVLGFIVFNTFSKKKIINLLLLLIITVMAGYILIVCTKRGPVLWTILSVVFLYATINRYKVKSVTIIAIIFILFYVFQDFIIDLIENFAPKSAERIYAFLVEGDTAHRFDSQNLSESAYFLSYNQFLSSPIWGFYYRLVTSNTYFAGFYPHNLFLEIMITMGLIGIVLFLRSLYQGLKYTIGYIQDSRNILLLSLFSLFITEFLHLQTTGTLLLNHKFWISLAFLFISPCVLEKKWKV